MGSQSHHKAPVNLQSISEDTKSEVGITHKAGSYVIPATSLSIIWGRDPRYWRIPSEGSDSKVELLQVCWLEVNASTECQKVKAGKYKMSFVVSLKADAFGWGGSPVYMMARVGKQPFRWKSADLGSRDPDPSKIFRIPDELVFEVTEKQREENEKLTFGLYEIWRGRWKGGLVIHEIILSPEP
ncbi:hypothetical protein ACLOJK_020055 [Asimina triloba]